MIEPTGRPNCGTAFVSCDSTKTRSPLFCTFRGGRSTGRAVVTVARTRIVIERGPVDVVVVAGDASDESSPENVRYATTAPTATTTTQTAPTATSFERTTGGYRRPTVSSPRSSSGASGVGCRSMPL